MSKTKITFRSVKNGVTVTIVREKSDTEILVYQRSDNAGRKEEIQGWNNFIYELSQNIGPEYDKYSQFNAFSYMLPGWDYSEKVDDVDVQENINTIAILCDLEPKQEKINE